MIRTLHGYLTKDLLKVATLALVAFTLVMTVFAIIEPLRKQGLGPEQVIALFGYTLPVTFSLTLPVAALFAATIVYGRFAASNELLACRASGIGLVSLLKPAMFLGLIVTVLTLGLSNFVAPKLASQAEEAIKQNVRGIAFHQLRTRSSVRFNEYVVHADGADAETSRLSGVVAANRQDPNDLRILVASEADVSFDRREGEWYLTIRLEDPAGIAAARKDIATFSSFSPGSFPLPNLTETSPETFTWQQLAATYENPSKHRDIHRKLVEIRRDIRHNMVVREIVRVLQAGQEFMLRHASSTGAADADGPRMAERTYVLSAPVAKIGGESLLTLQAAPDAAGDTGRVEVLVLEDAQPRQRVLADAGTLEVAWLAISNKSRITLHLQGRVEVQRLERPGQTQRRSDWIEGRIAIPEGIARRTERIDLDDIYNRAEQFTQDPDILREIQFVKEDRIAKVLGEIQAEMHGRIAYGLSCFLLVAMGAALGSIFRGGHIVSAFALSMIPAAIVIIMIIMGKTMVANPDVDPSLGLAAIWGGVIIVFVANGLLYLRLLRS